MGACSHFSEFLYLACNVAEPDENPSSFADTNWSDLRRTLLLPGCTAMS